MKNNCSASCNCNTNAVGKKKIKTRCSASCDCNIIHANAVDDAKKTMQNEDILLEMADFYKAMSDSTRIKILNLLCQHELCVCDISSILNMTKSAVSHQLQNLKEMNLIKSRKDGKEVFYSLADRHVKEVFDITLEHVLEGNE